MQLFDHDATTDCCSGSDPFDVTFDDSAASILGVIGAIGAFKPRTGPLSDFNGLDRGGGWHLQFQEMLCRENEADLTF